LIKICVILPVRNDYESAKKLINELESIFPNEIYQAKYLIIDDGSDAKEIEIFRRENFKDLVFLESNVRMGHQHSIYNALCYASEKYQDFFIIVMDADGEDKSQDALNLFLELKQNPLLDVVFAARGTREVSYTFKFFYKLYQILFKLLIGEKINSGNFLAIKPGLLKNYIQLPDIKTNVSASIKKYGSNLHFIEINRGARFFGKSRMNFTRLLLHAVSTLAVYSDILLIRIICLSFIATLLSLLAASLLLLAKLSLLFNFIPGWTSSIVIQLMSGSLTFMFIGVIGIILVFKTRSE
jgi:hypothetical protein